VGGAAYGFSAVWVNCSGAVGDRLEAKPWETIGALADLPPLLGA
jgi:hypothetical protein